MELTKQPLLCTHVNNLNQAEAVAAVDELVKAGKPSYIVEVNTDVMIKIDGDEYLRKITDEADMVLVDGMPLVWISKLKKNPVKERVSGSDLTLSVCKMAEERGYSVYIVGGSEEVAARAAENLRERYPALSVKGAYSPPFGFEKDENELAHIRALLEEAKPDIVFACLGCPKQEKWIYENYKKTQVPVYLCAGATVDFLAGNVKRAPEWICRIGFEWFYRFLMEPKRLFKRYFVDDMKIFRLYFKYKT